MSTLTLYPSQAVTNGEVGTPALFNDWLITLQAWSSTIDNSNIGSAGIFASQLVPTTQAQATFGGGVGYLHLAPAANVVPLTVSAVSGQSADILDVTLTSGGTKAVFVNSGGALAFGSLSGGPLPNGASITGGSSGALLLNTTSGQSITFSAGATGSTTLLTIGSTGAVAFVNAGGGALTNAASITGGASGAMLINTATGQNIQFSAGSGAATALGNINASTGNYTATSDERLKENVADLTLGLAEVLKLRPVSYDWIASKTPGQGFLAQSVQQLVPLAVSKVDAENDILGIADALLTPVVVKAIQEFYAEFNILKDKVASYVEGHP
jgi:Chaperone of endosialidase